MVTDHQPLVRLMEQQVLSRAQTRWIKLGLFQLIRPTIKYQPGKANIVANALSRSQQCNAQDIPPILPMAEDTDDQDQLFVLSQNGNTATAMTCTKNGLWPTNQDRSHKTAFNQLRQGKRVDKYYFIPIGLMAMMVGTQQKVIVPQS